MNMLNRVFGITIFLLAISANSGWSQGPQYRETDLDFTRELAGRTAQVQKQINSMRGELGRKASTTSAQSKEHVLLGREIQTPTAADSTDGEKRVPETLRHRDRSAADPDKLGRIKIQFNALEERVQAWNRLPQSEKATRSSENEVKSMEAEARRLQRKLDQRKRATIE